MTQTQRVGFIGTGRMATSLATGLRSAGLVDGSSLFGTDVIAAASKNFQEATGGQTVKTLAELAQNADVVFLSVKPQHMSGVLSELATHITDSHLIVSIAAGVPLRTMASALGQERRLVRVMPNTPCLVGAGASAFAMGDNAKSEDAELVKSLLETVGIAVEVPENLLDAVTGLSGSGPAYVYQIIEALSDGGVRMGLPRAIATQLAAQTLLGAARMVLETGEHPGVLKDAVTSPGGTTIAGLHTLERGGVRASLMNAVEAATKRSQELGSS